LGTYTKEFKSIYKRDTCIPVFIAALFTIAKLWDQLMCPTTNEWRYIHIFLWNITQP
jgi:hypothetical protein